MKSKFGDEKNNFGPKSYFELQYQSFQLKSQNLSWKVKVMRCYSQNSEIKSWNLETTEKIEAEKSNCELESHSNEINRSILRWKYKIITLESNFELQSLRFGTKKSKVETKAENVPKIQHFGLKSHS